MENFKQWLLASESSPESRALDAPWAYPAEYVGGNPNSERTASPRQLDNWKKMVKRDSKKKHHKKKKRHEKDKSVIDESKKGKKPIRGLDDFLDELMGLKGDLARSFEKKKVAGKLAPKSSPKATAAEGDLLKAAKLALSNLRTAPEFYSTRKADYEAGGEDASASRKVSRSDAIRVAKELGVDFRDAKFTQEAFRRAVASEFGRKSAFSREYPAPQPVG